MQDSPNVIVVPTDDRGYGDLGCRGNSVIRTPQMDRLHGESVRLTDESGVQRGAYYVYVERRRP